MAELVGDHTGKRSTGHDFFHALALRGDDHPALDDARRAFGREKFRRRDAQHPKTRAEEILQHGAVGVVDHVNAAAVVGADHAGRVGARDIAEPQVTGAARDARAEVRGRDVIPLLDRIAHQLICACVVDHAERAEIGIDIDRAFPARRQHTVRSRYDHERATRKRGQRRGRRCKGEPCASEFVTAHWRCSPGSASGRWHDAGSCAASRHSPDRSSRRTSSVRQR